MGYRNKVYTTRLCGLSIPFCNLKIYHLKKKVFAMIVSQHDSQSIIKVFLNLSYATFSKCILIRKMCNIPLFYRWFLLKLMVQIPCLVSKQVGHWPKLDYNFFSSLNPFPSLLEYKQIFFVLI